MSEPTLRDWLNDEQTIMDALAILKVGIDKGDDSRHAFRLAVAYVLTRWLPDEVKPYGSHDERISRLNRIFREFVMPLIPKGEIVLMLTCPSQPGLLTYISNGERADCVQMLKEVTTKWDQDNQ